MNHDANDDPVARSSCNNQNHNHNHDDTKLQKTLRLSALESDRTTKRQRMEELHQQKLSIESALRELEAELLQLDETIDALDYDDDGDDTGGEANVHVHVHVRNEQIQAAERSSSNTDPSAATLPQRPQHFNAMNEVSPIPNRIPQSQTQPAFATTRTHTHTSIRLSPSAKPSGTLDVFLGKKLPPTNPHSHPISSSSQQQQPATISPPTVSDPPNNTPSILPHQYQCQYQSHPRASSTTSSPAPFSDQQIQQTLESIFRIRSFRTNQRDIIRATLQGRDVFCIMRTGGGKSLTYQLPAYLEGHCHPHRKITFVVSPLLSLIHDQVNQMNAFVPNSALAIVSKIGVTETAHRWKQIRDPDSGVCLVFCTPEKVHQSQRLLSELDKLHAQNRLGRFVIDEAHCATQYGHDFRPDYAQLGKLKAHFGADVPVLAVTATASERVQQDVLQLLRLSPHTSLILRSTAARPNLHYTVQRKGSTATLLPDMVEWIQQHYGNNIAGQHGRAGIIYTLSKKDAATTARYLQEHGIPAAAYHSEVRNKEHIQEEWMRNKIQVVVATIAFGLGINKPDVRFVLHHSISKTLEAYYQESGRAGRDGNPAQCVLFYSPKDVIRMYKLVHGTNSEHLLFPMIRYGQHSGNDALCKAVILTHLGEPNPPDLAPIVAANDGVSTHQRDVGAHVKTLVRLLQQRTQEGKDMTLNMLVKDWRSTSASAPAYIRENSPGKDGLSVDDCERIVIDMLLEKVLQTNPNWNAYDTVIYFVLGPVGHQLLQATNPRVSVRLPIEPANSAKRKSPSRKSAAAASGEWLVAKPKRKASAKKKAAPKKKATKAKAKRKTAPKKQAPAKPQEVIELLEDDDTIDEDSGIENNRKGSTAAREDQLLWDDEDSDGEFEFDG